MVEHSLCMQEVPGLMPGIYTFLFFPPFVMLCVCYSLKHCETECDNVRGM